MSQLNLVSMKMVAVGAIQIAKDGRSFFTATISPGFGQKNISRLFWQQFKRDKATGLPTSEKYWERASHEEALEMLASKEKFSAARVTETVVPYTIGTGENANLVDQYTTVVFEDESIEKVFSNANHPLLNKESGEITDTRKKRAILATDEVLSETAKESATASANA